MVTSLKKKFQIHIGNNVIYTTHCDTKAEQVWLEAKKDATAKMITEFVDEKTGKVRARIEEKGGSNV